MPLIDLKRSASEIKEAEGAATLSEQDLYPWGLMLHFDDDTIKKLALDGALRVGDEVEFLARAKLTGTSEDETTEGTRRSTRMQLVAMETPHKPVPTVAAADRLYPGATDTE